VSQYGPAQFLSVAGDRLPAMALFGAAFMVMGIIISKVKPLSRGLTLPTSG
jgi:hypothetical protein